MKILRAAAAGGGSGWLQTRRFGSRRRQPAFVGDERGFKRAANDSGITLTFIAWLRARRSETWSSAWFLSTPTLLATWMLIDGNAQREKKLIAASGASRSVSSGSFQVLWATSAAANALLL